VPAAGKPLLELADGANGNTATNGKHPTRNLSNGDASSLSSRGAASSSSASSINDSSNNTSNTTGDLRATSSYSGSGGSGGPTSAVAWAEEASALKFGRTNLKLGKPSWEQEPIDQLFHWQGSQTLIVNLELIAKYQ
jgi:hypothetical protein